VAGIIVEEGVYPILLQGFPLGPKGEEALRDLFTHMGGIAARALRDGTVHVVVAVGDEHFTAAERKVIAEGMEHATPEEASRVVGAFAVIANPFARGVLTALRWLAPHAIPVVAAATPEEAVVLGADCLRRHGVDVGGELAARASVAARRLHARMHASLATGSR
jgi:hypothetical protein